MEYKTIKLKGGAVVTLKSMQTSPCRRCGKQVFWAVTKNAKLMPVSRDRDGGWISHFTDCVPQYKGDLLSEIQKQQERERW